MKFFINLKMKRTNDMKLKIISKMLLPLVFAAFFLAGCGNSVFNKKEIEAEINEHLPYYVKLESFKCDTKNVVKKGNEEDIRWQIEAPITIKYKIAENLHDILNIEPDYRRNGKENVFFTKLKYKKGEILERQGNVVATFEKDIDITEKGMKAKIKKSIFVKVDNFPSFIDKTLEKYEPNITVKQDEKGVWGAVLNSVPLGVPQSKMPSNTLCEADAVNYKNKYKEMVKDFPILVQGEWEGDDAIVFYDETNEYIVFFKKDKSLRLRKYGINQDGLFEFQEVFNPQANGFEKLVKIDGADWYSQDVEKSGWINAELRYTDKINNFKKIKGIKERGTSDEEIRKNLIGVWETNWWNKENDSYAKFHEDGTLLFQEKNSTHFEKGSWSVKNGFILFKITENHLGNANWQRWQFIEKLDSKNFVLRQVKSASNDKDMVWEGAFLRSLEEDLKLKLEKENMLKSKISGIFTESFDMSRGNYRDKIYSPFYGKRFWLSYVEFKDGGLYEQKFYNKSQSNGKLTLEHLYKGNWKLDGDVLSLAISEKDGGSASEVFKYRIEFDKSNNMGLSAIGNRGYLFGKLVRSFSNPDGSVASSSAGMSLEEQNIVKSLNSLIAKTNEATKKFAEIKRLGNSPKASNLAAEMKKGTMPNLCKLLEGVKKSLSENKGKIDKPSLDKYFEIAGKCEKSINDIKSGLSEYSTLEEGVDNIKSLGDKIFNLF